MGDYGPRGVKGEQVGNPLQQNNNSNSMNFVNLSSV